MYYALQCNQTGRMMCTGRNTTSIKDLAAEYKEYLSADYDEDDPDDKEILDVLEVGEDEQRIRDIIQAMDYTIEEEHTPFNEINEDY